ncbi:hypothetical protein M3Y98_00046300 [Aphelenchoides besseyi]|nr:hypothetical protein M3Y98_00046300 [Aphelenchoides besseyi]KAI6198985.1 hypothetical protein M3Y96_00578700 [Aphelenchoides besseyi]
MLSKRLATNERFISSLLIAARRNASSGKQKPNSRSSRRSINKHELVNGTESPINRLDFCSVLIAKSTRLTRDLTDKYPSIGREFNLVL